MRGLVLLSFWFSTVVVADIYCCMDKNEVPSFQGLPCQRHQIAKRFWVKETPREPELKEKRRKNRCSHTHDKIRVAQRKLRRGCKVRECEQLRDKIKHWQYMQGYYCQ